MTIGGRSVAALVRKYGTPLYVYDAKAIKARCAELLAAFPGFDLSYAAKANTHPGVLKLIFAQGFGVEAVSPGEVRAARRAGVPVTDITFTCSSISEDELASVAGQGVRVHLDSLHQVDAFGQYFPGRKISVRLNQGIGGGHHAHVVTGGPESKFGVDIAHIGKLKKLAAKYGLPITGLHQHIGSNVLDQKIFLRAMKVLLDTALRFPDLERVDFGGGLGVPYGPGVKGMDIKVVGREAVKARKAFEKKYGRPVRMSFEPGRYPVAEAGYLLVSVTDIKRNPKKTFVGVNSGFNHLIRPAMYGSYHEIVNASRTGGKKEKVTVAGNICESGDVFARDRLLVMPRIGDILAIKKAGAYGYTMSSDYNLRPKPKEVLI